MLPTYRDICHQCGAQCCKRYWIVLLPEEASRLAEFQGQGEEAFLQEKTSLYLQLFPVPGTLKGAVPFQKLPSSVRALLLARKKPISPFFLPLPGLALKRNQGSCVFLAKDLSCSVYAARPRPCQLFPFLSLGSREELKQSYPFCLVLDQEEPPAKVMDDAHRKKMAHYFDEAAEKGVKKMWPALPGKGIALLGKEELGAISLLDFLECFGD